MPNKSSIATSCRNKEGSGLEFEFQDLSNETLRDITLAIIGAYLLWIFIGGMTWPVEYGLDIWLGSIFFMPGLILTIWLLKRNPGLARITLQASLVIGISVNLIVFQKPEITFFFTLLPLISVTISGWKAGLVMELVVAFMIFGITKWLLASTSASVAFMVLVGGVFTGILGYATRRTLMIVTERSLYSYSEARINMLEAREHRARLVKLLKDLDLAYYRLERANSALMSASKAAEAAERFKTELVTTISHELRTPLNLVIGFVEVIMTSPESYGNEQIPPTYRSDLNAIYRSALHILALVDDVIDMARLDIGKLGMSRSWVEPGEVIVEAIEMVRDYINTKGLSLNIQLENEFPPLWIDRIRVRQVLLNLLVNAARFTNQGSITLQAKHFEDKVLIKLNDTGQGITGEDLPHVFDEFKTSDKSGASWHSGSGLGLPISKKIIEAHGGKMGVESVFGEGATFWFTLPVLSGKDQQGPDIRVTSNSYTIRPAQLADPVAPLVVTAGFDPWIQALFQRELGDFQVQKASSPEQAFKLAVRDKALAVITEKPVDIPPGLDKCLFIHCPMPSTRRAAESLGVQDLLVKPVTAHLLWETIHYLNLHPQKALIIDDDVNITRLFNRMLRVRIAKDQIVEVNNGDEALSMIRKCQPDLILLDLDMPGTNGLKILEQKTADAQLAQIPVIIITGHENDLINEIPGGNIIISRSNGFYPSESIQAVESLLKVFSQ